MCPPPRGSFGGRCAASVGIETLFGCANLTTTLPAAVAGGIGALHLAMNNIAAGSAAVALAAIPMLLSKRNAARNELGKSPVTYLLRMKQSLKPPELQGWWRQGLRRLVPGS